jgi:radical SAM protein with 4Fe4S-binding SPASM domain
MTRRLRDIGIRIIQFSIDSSDSKIVDLMVGVPQYHRRAFRALENLRQAGLTVRVNTVVTPINAGAVGQLLDYLGALGNVKRVSLTPYGRSSFRHNDELFLSTSGLDRLSEEVSNRQPRYPHMRITVGGNVPARPQDPKEERLGWERRAFCTGNRDGFVILPDGRVTPCEELYDHPSLGMGDLSRQSVMQMWNSPEALALIFPDQGAVPDGPCKTCDEFTTCNSGRGRCWRDILKSYGWDKPHWPDPRCPKATAGSRLS